VERSVSLAAVEAPADAQDQAAIPSPNEPTSPLLQAGFCLEPPPTGAMGLDTPGFVGEGVAPPPARAQAAPVTQGTMETQHKVHASNPKPRPPVLGRVRCATTLTEFFFT
jgi:hypothetical protein